MMTFVRILGIDFHSEQLVGIRKKIGNSKCPVYVDPDSLGTVSVYVKGEWVEVPNSIEDFRGISVAEWNAVGEILRRRYAAKARVNFSDILAALEYVRVNATEAQKIVGTLPQAATSEEFDRFEKNLWHGISVYKNQSADLSGLRRVAYQLLRLLRSQRRSCTLADEQMSR